MTTPVLDTRLRALIKRAEELQATEELWDLRDIGRAVGFSPNDRAGRYRLRVATENYWRSGLATWPPTAATLRTPIQVPSDEDPECLTDWPDHPGVLPPPDVPDPINPRWLSGRIYAWAMLVGRMALDGTPLKTTARGLPRKTQPHPDISGVDFELWQRLVGDETLWSIDDLAAELNLLPRNVGHLFRAARSMRSGGLAWPPSRDAARQLADPPIGKAVVEDWPHHHRLLPPPDAMDDLGINRFYGEGAAKYFAGIRWLWKAGKAREWAMLTGRMTLDGRPIALRPARGDA